MEERQGQASVTLTLDKRIQQIAERTMKDVDKGAVIVSDLTTGELLAVVSKPVFDPNALWESLTDEDKPFVNRAFSGLMWVPPLKIVWQRQPSSPASTPPTPIPAPESIDVDGQVYNCLEKNGHGTITMLEAVEHSCNTYFIDLGLKVGYDKVYAMARALGLWPGYGVCARACPLRRAISRFLRSCRAPRRWQTWCSDRAACWPRRCR